MKKNVWAQALCAFGGCLEVLEEEDGSRRIRSSQEPGTEVRATAPEWAAFLSAVKEGRFD